MALCSSLSALERRHRVEHDAQVMFPGDLSLGLADSEQLAEAGSARARGKLEADHGIPQRRAYSVLIDQTN
jgi:hypothetical protein